MTFISNCCIILRTMSKERQPNGANEESKLADVIALPFSKWNQYVPADKDADVILMRTSKELSAEDSAHPSQHIAEGDMSGKEYARISALTNEYRREGQHGVALYLAHYAANLMHNDASFDEAVEKVNQAKEQYHRIQQAYEIKRRIAEVGQAVVSDE